MKAALPISLTACARRNARGGRSACFLILTGGRQSKPILVPCGGNQISQSLHCRRPRRLLLRRQRNERHRQANLQGEPLPQNAP